METQGTDLAASDAVGDRGRSRLLSAAAEREQLERVVRMLPRALDGGTPEAVAEVLAEGSCLLANARVAWVVLPEWGDATVVGGPDAPHVDHASVPARWPVVATALGGASVHVADVLDCADRDARDGCHRARGMPLAAPVDRKHALVTTGDGRVLRSLSAVPIRGADDVLGALVLAHHRAHAFSERQLALAGVLAAHLGRALDICEAVRAQTRIATALQETLLPPVLPHVEGVELAACYRPNGSGNLVGGDFYDVFGDGAGGWYVLLGDASGIGPEAAGLAGVARYTARALAETASGPAEILVHMNRALLRAAPEDRFCTAVLAHLRSSAGGALTVSLCVAGHPPPFLQRADGTVAPAIGATGLLLGILPDAAIGEASLVLGPGDALVCYTDGVVEAHGPGKEQFGEERLAAVLADACRRSAAGIARRIERAVVDFRLPDMGDDLAVVAVRCGPGA